MNFKLTVALTIVLMLALFAYLWTPQKTTPTKTTAGAATPLLDPKPSDVVNISFSRYGVEELMFVKKDTQWKMVTKETVDADNDQLSSIASSLQNLAYVEKFEPEATGARSADYTGVAKPDYVIKFSDKDNHNYTVNVGKNGTQGRFVTVGTASTIYVLNSDPATQLNKNANTFRNLQVVTLDQPNIMEVAMKSRDDAWQITKSGDKWLVNRPVSARASQTAVDEILHELQNVRAVSFSRLSKSEAGLEPPVATITATLKDTSATAPATTSGPASAPAATPGKKVELQIGYASEVTVDKKDSPVYASLSDSKSVFILSNASAKIFLKQLRDVRDSAVTPVSLIGATDVTVTTDGKTTMAANLKDGAWNLTAPETLKADSLAMSDFLNAASTLRAIKFVDGAGDLKSIGLDPPHEKIELAVPGQTQHEVILLGNSETDPDKGKVTPAMRQGESTVFMLPTADADKLSPGLLALRNKEIERLDAMKIRSIAITGPMATGGVVAAATSTAPATAPATGPAGAPGIVLERAGTHWNAKKDGADLVVDETKLTSLLGQFTPVIASRYLDEQAPTGVPDITVTVTVLESANVPATNPATAPATAPASAPATSPATAPATNAAASTAPATAPNISDILPTAIGPDAGKLETRTLKLYKIAAAASAPATATAPTTAPATAPAAPTWKAVWDEQSPAWTFEPSGTLVDDVTKETYATTAQPATAPATQAATAPATTKP